MKIDWEKAKLIFSEALRLPPEQRTLFLKQSCEGDEAVYREVESLLESFEEDSFLETPACTALSETLFANKSKFKSGQILDHYKVVRQLGAGGMGEVYLATDTRLHRQVALKVLPAEFMLDPDRVRRFQQEAFAASALNHPNILTIHEIGEFDNTSFIASEFIEGETLRERSMGKPMPLEEAVDIALQTATALAAAHESGIVHRDIKPENIMIRGDRLVKVLDFGLAKLGTSPPAEGEAGNRPRVETATGSIMGTTAYMSPEQARGKETDSRTDIFSFGIVFYEMLTGEPPFAGETTSDVIAAILKSDPQSIRDLVPDVPAEVESIVEKTLRKNRDERYQHIKDLVVDLRELKQDLEFSSKQTRFPLSTAAARETAATRSLTLRTSSAEYLVSELKTHKAAAAAALLLLTIGLAAFLFFRYGISSDSKTNDVADSIAVLPFENAARDPRAEYLSDGISESLINHLSKLSSLRVISSSAVVRYKGTKPETQKVAAELNVTAVLTGSVNQVGDQLIINVSLDDAKTNRRIWGERYMRDFTDVLTIQSDIAHEVASNLRLKLTGGDERQLAKRYTESPAAYELYLKGNYHWKKQTPQDSQKGIEYYNQAIAIDPNYAMAYTGLANSYGVLALTFLPPREGFSKAKEYAAKALEIDETLADAHSSMGAVRLFYDWNWVEAERELRTALELNPNHFDANIVYSAFLSAMGRFDESHVLATRSQQLEPLSAWTNTQLGINLYASGQYDECVAQLEKTINIDPRYSPAYLHLGQAYSQKKMYDRAIATFHKGIEYTNRDPHLLSSLGHAYALAGERGKAHEVLKELDAISKRAYISSYLFAVVWAGLADRDQTLGWLKKAHEERFFAMSRLKVEPIFKPFHDDPRFQELLKSLNFPG